ncbi:MAG TPA: YqaJ viral recombinase family protein [Calditerricola sp.]
MGAQVLVRTKGMDRSEWLEWRRRGIGGSDAAAVAGLDLHKSPFRVWLEKTGQVQDDAVSEAALWGTLLEPVIAAEFSRRTGLRVRRRNAILQHPQHDFMIANIDREIMGERALLEVKTTSAFNRSDVSENRMPDRYVVQAQHYLAVTGYDRCYMAVLIGGQELVITHVDRDDELIASLIEIERRFWFEHVVPKVPPAPDASDDARELLHKMYAHAEPDSVVDLPPEAAEWLRIYREAEASEKAAAARKQEAANRIKAWLQHHEYGRLNGVPVVRWREVQQTRLDTKRLKKERPDVYDAYATKSTQRRFELLSKGDE